MPTELPKGHMGMLSDLCPEMQSSICRCYNHGAQGLDP